MFQLTKVTIFLLLAVASSSFARSSSYGRNPSSPKALSDLKEAITKGLGFQADEVKVSEFDVRDVLVGHSVAYEFDVEIGNKVIPLKLLEDVNRWKYVDLPIFRMEDLKASGKELVERNKVDDGLPVLEPFQLAGPMELWIQDAKDMRISLPHDVDAGVLKKVILAEGAVVTVKGARSVSLRHTVELPLPLNRTHSGFASGILSLAERLRQASLIEGAPLLSLRIVGPTSLSSPTSSTNSPANRLRLKRLAPGLVELSSPKPKAGGTTDLSPVSLEDAKTLLTPTQFSTMWPLTAINASHSNLLGFEALLSSVLDPKANKKGSFKLLKADVSAQTYMKIGFQVEKKINEDDGMDFSNFPTWRTKPENVRMHFEVLAKVDGDKIFPERVMQVNPFAIEDTAPPSVLTGNVTMSTIPIIHPAPDPFTL